MMTREDNDELRSYYPRNVWNVPTRLRGLVGMVVVVDGWFLDTLGWFGRIKDTDCKVPEMDLIPLKEDIQ